MVLFFPSENTENLSLSSSPPPPPPLTLTRSFCGGSDGDDYDQNFLITEATNALSPYLSEFYWVDSHTKKNPIVSSYSKTKSVWRREKTTTTTATTPWWWLIDFSPLFFLFSNSNEKGDDDEDSEDIKNSILLNQQQFHLYRLGEIFASCVRDVYPVEVIIKANKLLLEVPSSNDDAKSLFASSPEAKERISRLRNLFIQKMESRFAAQVKKPTVAAQSHFSTLSSSVPSFKLLFRGKGLPLSSPLSSYKSEQEEEHQHYDKYGVYRFDREKLKKRVASAASFSAVALFCLVAEASFILYFCRR